MLLRTVHTTCDELHAAFFYKAGLLAMGRLAWHGLGLVVGGGWGWGRVLRAA